MGYPIETVGASGLTLYAVAHHPDGTVWNTATSEWEAFSAGNWSLYATYLAEQGASGYYRAIHPVSDETILVTEAVYVQGGGSPSQGDAPASGIGQSQGSAIGAVMYSRIAAANMAKNLDIMKSGLAVAGTLTTTQMSTNLRDSYDAYKGRLLVWTSGTLIRRATYIAHFDPATLVLTFGQVERAPVVGDAFLII